jgi:hypothetical protein
MPGMQFDAWDAVFLHMMQLTAAEMQSSSCDVVGCLECSLLPGMQSFCLGCNLLPDVQPAAGVAVCYLGFSLLHLNAAYYC